MKITHGNQTTILPDTTPTMTYEEWRAEGSRRFGEDHYNWKFKCPVCGNVAAIADFKQYQEKGASPNSATQQCIGRYLQKRSKAFGDKQPNPPCDYALYGLFRLPGVIVQMPDGVKEMCFAFADPA